MAFPASQQTLEDALVSVRNTAVKLRGAVQTLRNQSAAGDTNRSDYTNLQRSITVSLQQWDQAAAVPGLSAYAQSQYNDGTLDIAAEYTAMRASAVALRQWVFDNIPKQGSSPLLYTIDLEGALTNMTVTPAQTAGFRTEADVFLATIG